MSKVFRLKVKRVPLNEDIIYRKPYFSQFNDLHLDLLENKLKLKKNAPKPIFVRKEQSPPREEYKESRKSDKKASNHSIDSEDLTLEELEKVYSKYDDNDDTYSIKSDDSKGDHDRDHERDHDRDHERDRDRDHDRDHDKNNTHREEYTQQEFVQHEEEQISEEEKEKQEKDELLFNFMVLRRKYPNLEIPEFTEHSDITTMRRAYDQILRKVSLDSSVDNYKKYLIGGFAVLEWVATNWLGIDLSGLTQHQIAGMNSYERLLVELGEKNFSVQGSRFPVEVRLLFMMLFNAGLFYIQKMLMTGSGNSGNGGGFNIMNMFFGGGNTNQQQTQQKKKRRPMGGPTITPDDIENLSKDSDKEKDD